MSFEVGQELPELVIDEVTRGMFVRYAGASGDFNPIHWDEGYASSAGYPTVFGMGMFTAGVLARMATDAFGPENVRRYKVRFTGQVWPGDELRCRGTVTRVYDAAGTAGSLVDLELTVSDGDGNLKVRGEATGFVS